MNIPATIKLCPPPPTPHQSWWGGGNIWLGGGGGYCFWDRSCWHLHQCPDRCKTSCPLCNLNTLWNILMLLGRNVDQDKMTCCIQDWQLWLSYFLSYHPLIGKRFCVLSVTQTLWNISMVLDRNVEQDAVTCSVQEWQLCLSYFWRYPPLLYLTVIIHWFRVCSVSQRPFGIFFDTW